MKRVRAGKRVSKPCHICGHSVDTGSCLHKTIKYGGTQYFCSGCVSFLRNKGIVM